MKTYTVILLYLLLSSCGGGGGSSPEPEPTISYSYAAPLSYEEHQGNNGVSYAFTLPRIVGDYSSVTHKMTYMLFYEAGNDIGSHTLVEKSGDDMTQLNVSEASNYIGAFATLESTIDGQKIKTSIAINGNTTISKDHTLVSGSYVFEHGGMKYMAITYGFYFDFDDYKSPFWIESNGQEFVHTFRVQPGNPRDSTQPFYENRGGLAVFSYPAGTSEMRVESYAWKYRAAEVQRLSFWSYGDPYLMDR